MPMLASRIKKTVYYMMLLYGLLNGVAFPHQLFNGIFQLALLELAKLYTNYIQWVYAEKRSRVGHLDLF